jgi:hypothetical protein
LHHIPIHAHHDYPIENMLSNIPIHSPQDSFRLHSDCESSSEEGAECLSEYIAQDLQSLHTVLYWETHFKDIASSSPPVVNMA